MTALVVDASVAFKWVVEEIHSEAALNLIAAGHPLAAPELLLAEVGSALGRRVGRRLISANEAKLAIEAVERTTVEWQPIRPLVFESLRLANTLEQSIYDCVYLALAERRASQVVTADRKFYEAIQRSMFASFIVWIEDAARLA